MASALPLGMDAGSPRGGWYGGALSFLFAAM